MVTPWETVEGLRIIGFNIFSSLFIAFVIHVFMSLPTAEPWLGIFPFDPLFRIWTKNIHKGKHGSDSGTFDTEGRFIPQKFEEVFTKWGTDKERMSLSELYQMTSDLSVAMDPFGWYDYNYVLFHILRMYLRFAAKFEWGVLWWLCADDDWMVSRECIRSALDGSLFYILEEEQNRCKLE